MNYLTIENPYHSLRGAAAGRLLWPYLVNGLLRRIRLADPKKCPTQQGAANSLQGITIDNRLATDPAIPNHTIAYQCLPLTPCRRLNIASRRFDDLDLGRLKRQ